MAIAYIDKGEVFGGMHDIEIVGEAYATDAASLPGISTTGTDMWSNTIPKAYPGSTYKDKLGNSKTLYPDGTWA